MREPTNIERVLRLSRRQEGVAQPDVLKPAVDGWKPITRLAARILELEHQGYTFDRPARRNRCTIYRLAAEPSVERGRGERTADVSQSSAADGGSGSTPSCPTVSLGARRRPRAATQHPSDDSSVGERGRPTPLQEEMFPDPTPSAYRTAA